MAYCSILSLIVNLLLNASHKIKAYLDMTIENQINHLTFIYGLFNFIAIQLSFTTQVTT